MSKTVYLGMIADIMHPGLINIINEGAKYGDVIIGLFKNATEKGLAYPLTIMALSFIYVRFSGLSIVWLVLGCIAAGVAKALLVKREEERS